MTEKVLLGFSGGKDSCLALHEILQNTEFEVAALLTTLTEGYQRISMHGIRESLLDQQVESIGLIQEKVWIPQQAGNEEYETRMSELLMKYKRLGIEQVVFGDIFLNDIRMYREAQLKKCGMQGMFPLWGKNTRKLASSFVDRGFKAISCCVDRQSLDRRFVGQEMDQSFFDRLPAGIDACGENGEFHSFVYDGPIFKKPLNLRTGEIVLRENRFYYCDLLPG